MRIPTLQNRRGLGFDMTPMIDVVFNLIIFFLLSSHLARQEVQRPLDLPVATTGARPATQPAPRRVVLQVAADGEATLSGRAVRPVDLTTALAAEQARAGHAMEVRIRADRRVPYRHIEPILKSCAALGIWDVTFAVVREAE